MKVLILDDDDVIGGFIQNLIKKFFPQFKSIEYFSDPISAAKAMLENEFDLFLFDVELGSNETVFDYLGSFNLGRGSIIFITGHPDYAIKALKMQALDYLLKPVNIEEFKAAVNKAIQSMVKQNETVSVNDLQNLQASRLVVNELDQIRLIVYGDIEYFEGSGPYTRIHLINGTVLTSSKNLKYYDELTAAIGFYRVHNSYMANVFHIKQIIKKDGLMLEMASGKKVDVSVRKKEEFLNYLDRTII